MSTWPTLNDIPDQPDKRRAWIVYELRYHYGSLRKFAARIGVSQSAIMMALARPSVHIEGEISKALRLPGPALFPERYAADGTRRYEVRPQKRTKKSRYVHVQSAGRV